MDEISTTPKEVRDLTTPRLGFAIASLILGILAVVLSPLVVVVLLGLIGLILGVVHLRGRPREKATAWWGVSLSILGMMASLLMGSFYYHAYRQFKASRTAGQGAAGADVEQWQGVVAPDITVTTIDGETLQLSRLRGKRVILDFWATWCPPCVKEIPHFVQLFNETSRDELVIVGISSEDESTLKSFVKANGMKYPIASIAGTTQVSPYADVQSIPTTFFIDRKGVIQFIAVGYHSFADLKESALAEDVKSEPKQSPSPVLSELRQSTNSLTVHEAWNTSVSGANALTVGDWDSDGVSDLLVAAGKELRVLSVGGTEKVKISLPGRFAMLEAGRHATQGARLLGYDNWGNKVTVMDAHGREIWSYRSSQGVNGAHWGDLDGDGTDELIVGMNGGGGLHAVSSEGKKLWADTEIGNVWNQAVIPATKDRSALIFATEAGGTVRVYDAKGKLQRTIRPQGKYCTQMTAKLVDNQGRIQGITSGEGRIIAFDPHGQVNWSTPAIKDNGGWRQSTFAGGDLTGDAQGEWVFLEAAGNLAVVNWQGEKLASLPAQSRLEHFTIVPTTQGKGVLVTLSGGSVRAYAFDSSTPIR